MIKCLRLVKLYPILKVFEAIKQKVLNFGRIIEMLFLYYAACHIIACSFINIAYRQDDIRETWLRRLTVPQPEGMRLENSFDGLSDTTIYVHALEFTVNTVSHLAIGEITTINYRERIYNAFVILCGTFIYAFLFGNIASIMTEFASQMPFFKLHKQFEDVMNSLNKEAVPMPLISKIKDYYDYIWANSGGVSQDEILMDYLNAEAANKSIIFKDDNGEVDNALTNSVMTFLEYRIYMDGDFIVIGGSSSMNTYFLLEGEAIIIGLNEEFIGYMKTGGHYSNDLDDDNENTFDYKRPFHIVSKGISKVGILNRSKLYDLYIAFPRFKETLRDLNTNFADYITKFCRKYLKSNNLDYNAENVIKTVSNHYCYSTYEVYNSVLKKCRAISLDSEEIQEYDIIIKQQEISFKCAARRKDSKRSSTNIMTPSNLFEQEEKKKGCLEKFKFDKNSTLGRIIDFLNLINLLYVAVSIPLLISFDIKMSWYTALLEILSLLFTLIIIFLNFRNPVHLRGGKTLKFKIVLSYYYNNGLILDLFALWPLSFVLAITDVVQPVWLITPLKCVRLISVWKILNIFGRFELFFKKLGLFMNIIKALLFLCIIWHWTSCAWFFTNLYINLDRDDSWMEFNNLQDGPLYKQVLYSYYTIMNVVSTVGYGDMFPMTDVERIFITLLINSGDLIFAVAFGLIAGISMQASNNKSTEIFFKKMHMIKELIDQNRGDEKQKSKVEQYFAYSWHLHKSTKMFSIKSLSTQLPYRLSREVVYFSTRHLLEPMFKSFGSENLIKDISTSLVQTIYLPGDFIILKDDIGEEMYFIAEGSVYILAADKRTVLNTLTQGYYFGEMAIFLKSNRRTAYVQAETFCSILILKKYDLDNIKVNYPAVAKDIIKEAEKRQAETREIEEAYKDEIWDDEKNPEDQKNDLERIYGTPPDVKRTNFSPKMFDLTSRRSSFQGKESIKEDLAFHKFHKNLIKDGSNSSEVDPSSSFNKLKIMFQKHHSERILPHKFDRKKDLGENKSKFLKESDIRTPKSLKRKSNIQNQESLTKKVIHEDVENEDKASLSSYSKEESKHLFHKRSGKIGSFSPIQRDKIPKQDDLNFGDFTMQEKERSMPHGLSGDIFKTKFKRSTTEKIKEEGDSPSLHKSKIDQIVTSVDMERKLASRTPKRMKRQNTLFESPKHNVIDYRREGVHHNDLNVHKQRRLSRINLGKQLELSETLGLRLQWRVD
ncbi:unnamed protein product [Moneuplotes crassus]|uniref:Cyclic nucleotide-binding domain-containing protein n=1 Tax=Euplotes crassus TaxID=5936 RepID=A0AAD1UHV6_EUPCR|nr:unnamed protein product [Moneuplotes crassus]